MKLQWMYCVGVPAQPGLPLVLQEWGQPQRTITLGQARDAIFKAAVQGHQIITEKPHTTFVMAVIYIVDHQVFENQYQDWKTNHSHESIGSLEERS